MQHTTNSLPHASKLTAQPYDCGVKNPRRLRLEIRKTMCSKLIEHVITVYNDITVVK
jgi:hypothetical protein